MNAERGRLVSGGRLQIPARVRRALGLKDGDAVLIEAVEGEVRVRPYRQAVAKAQEIVRRHIPGGVSLSEELIADRREEAERE
jgi:AbrB family looped-hinge helix DNA binding protein